MFDKILRYLLRKESRLKQRLFSQFSQQKKELISNLQNNLFNISFFTKKWNNKIFIFYKKELPSIIKRWWWFWYQKFKKQLWNQYLWNFFKWDSLASEYFDNITQIQLSEYKGSITTTTNEGIKEILKKWVDEWKSYWQIAKEINEVDPFIFSKSRAKLIALTETWNAFGYWDYIVWKDLQKQWFEMEKRAITRGDARVRATHRHNAREGWIDYNKSFSWTWSLYLPNGFRCRCNMDKRIKK